MDYWNYLPWVAKYSTHAIKEDQTIKNHFLQIDPTGLEEIYYLDGLTRYSLDCHSGQFRINDNFLNLRAEGQYIPPVGPVACKIVSPTEQFTKDGIFQYKQAIGKTTKELQLGIQSYNIGFRKTKDNLSVYQRMILDGQTGKIVIQVKLYDYLTGKSSEHYFPMNL